MKKLVAIISLLAAMVCGMSCASPEKGPEAAAKKALTAIQKGDYDAYAATFNLPESDQKMLAGMAEEKINEQIKEKGGIKGFKIDETTVDGDKATVKATVTYKDGSEEKESLHFEKVENEWKQVLDK